MTTQLSEYLAIQSQGASADGSADRQGGAGPSDAKAFIIGGHPMMIPTLSQSAHKSDYALSHPANDNTWRLEKNGQFLFHVQAVPVPQFYSGQTSDGISYKKIARLHGADGLASTVVQACVRYDNPRTRCRFCAIGASLESGATTLRKTPEQLAEVAVAAKELDHVTHVTLTAGTTLDPDQGALYLGECAKAVKDASGLPVQVQFEPLRDRSLYARLKEMGVDDVGLHVESFDPSVRKRMTPGKAEVTLEEYFQAFADAVAVFGRNKVSTYVILGLGEDEDLTLNGCEKAAALGVYPFVVPLRPLSDSYLSKATAPDPAYLSRVYTAVGAILDRYGLSASGSTAGCVRCRACSPLQFIEGASHVQGAQCRATVLSIERPQAQPVAAPQVKLCVASTSEELAEYHKVRQEVFVSEQGLFSGSDQDVHDSEAVPIIALVDGRVAGVVRCYHDGAGVWFGGRLAVRPEYRVGFNLGPLLVKKAVEIMEERSDVQRFLATVQIQNVRFFQRLGWVRIGEPFVMQGCKHQTMEKKLREVKS